MKTLWFYLLVLLIILFVPSILIIIGMAVNPNFLSLLLTYLESGVGVTFFVLAILIVVPPVLINREKVKLNPK